MSPTAAASGGRCAISSAAVRPRSAALIVLLLVVAAVFAPLIAPYDPYAIDVKDRLLPPGLEHLFGTDDLGRDMFSRIIYGARTTHPDRHRRHPHRGHAGIADRTGLRLLWRQDRSVHHALHRCHAGLSLHPVGAGHRGDVGAEPAQRADRHRHRLRSGLGALCARQRALDESNRST